MTCAYRSDFIYPIRKNPLNLNPGFACRPGNHHNHYLCYDSQTCDSANSACDYSYKELDYLIKSHVAMRRLKNTNTQDGLQKVL